MRLNIKNIDTNTPVCFSYYDTEYVFSSITDAAIITGYRIATIYKRMNGLIPQGLFNFSHI